MTEPAIPQLVYLAYSLCAAQRPKRHKCDCAAYNGVTACRVELAGARAVVDALLEIVKEPAAVEALNNILREPA